MIPASSTIVNWAAAKESGLLWCHLAQGEDGYFSEDSLGSRPVASTRANGDMLLADAVDHLSRSSTSHVPARPTHVASEGRRPLEKRSAL